MIKAESFAYNEALSCLCPNRAMNFNVNFTHYTKILAGNALMRLTVCGRAALPGGVHEFIDSFEWLNDTSALSNSLERITIVIVSRYLIIGLLNIAAICGCLRLLMNK